MPTLTGRRRHRVLKRRLRQPILVLQVEVTGLSVTNCGGYVDCETITWWRDALPEDITVEGP